MARALLVSALATVSFALLTTASRAADGTLQVVPIGLGSINVDQPPTHQENSDGQDCNHGEGTVQDFVSNRGDVSGECTLTYSVGTTVTLTAAGSAGDSGPPDDFDGPLTSFRRWSDDRCGYANSCTLTIENTPATVSALFDPQRVTINLNGADGVVTSSAGQLMQGQDTGCTAANGSRCTIDFTQPELQGPVQLHVDPSWSPLWYIDQTRLLCDNDTTQDESTCSVTPGWPRWASVGFGGNDPDQPGVPPDIGVNFRIVKVGGGSGTVRGERLDCGTACAATQKFGAPETLQAIADPGSRFAGWRGACGSDATCRLAVGPVTAVTAVFERAVSQTGPTTGPTPTPSPRKSRLVKLNVRGHGRKRAILMRVELGGPASVRARLLHRRHQVTARRWQLKAGSYLLRMKVPARVRPGRYRIGLTVSSGGQTQQIMRPVRLRR
jgi:hypothetical protein